jgi:hypothetical protein
MSTILVDTINEKTSGNGVDIPGHVLQVVEAEFSTQTDISSTSYADSGLSVSITPTSSSSKILVITNVHCFINGTGFIGLNIVRGSTQIAEASKAVSFADNTGNMSVLTKLDSPSTASATTYKVQMKISSASGTLRINQQDGGSRITVMEIGG